MSPFTLQLESKTLSYDRQDFLSVEQRLDVSKQLEGFSNLPDFSNKKKKKLFSTWMHCQFISVESTPGFNGCFSSGIYIKFCKVTVQRHISATWKGKLVGDTFTQPPFKNIASIILTMR